MHLPLHFQQIIFFVSSKKGHKRKEKGSLKRKKKKEKYMKNGKYTLMNRGKTDKNQIVKEEEKEERQKPNYF